MQKMQVRSLGQENPLEEKRATHPSILTWRNPWTEEPGGLQSTGSQRVRHNWARIHTHTHTHTHYCVSGRECPLYWGVHTHGSANSLQQNFLVKTLWYLPDSLKSESESLRTLSVVIQAKDGLAETSTSEDRLQDQASDGHPSGVYLQRGDQGTFPSSYFHSLEPPS